MKEELAKLLDKHGYDKVRQTLTELHWDRSPSSATMKITARDGIKAKRLLRFLETANPRSEVLLTTLSKVRTAELDVGPRGTPLVILGTEKV
ncbi:MAG: hypothetical protein AB7U75_14815 [Hyphomicrobiaceae bacterium]